jgi:hypothetical protein
MQQEKIRAILMDTDTTTVLVRAASRPVPQAVAGIFLCWSCRGGTNPRLCFGRLPRLECASDATCREKHAGPASIPSYLVLRDGRDKPTARPSEPGHHGSDRHAGHLSNLPVGKPLDVAQDHGLPICHWQSGDGRLQAGGVGLCDQRRFRGSLSGSPGSAFAVSTASRSSTTRTADGRFLRSHV